MKTLTTRLLDLPRQPTCRRAPLGISGRDWSRYPRQGIV
jgi:hypothetical protein